MKTKGEIVENWLPRYTGEKLANFGEYILLTNFSNYVKLFAEWNNVEIVGLDRSMQCATANNITIINFGMGSASAATVMDLLSAISPKAVLFLGKCGGLKKKNQIGDLVDVARCLFSRAEAEREFEHAHDQEDQRRSNESEFGRCDAAAVCQSPWD